MIVGIIGKYESDSKLFYSYNKILKDNFVLIDSDVLSKVVGIGVLVNCTKKCVLLKSLESTWGNVCVVGNLFIDEEVTSAIINSGGKVFSIQPSYKGMEGRKWDSPNVKPNVNTIPIFDLQAENSLREFIPNITSNRREEVSMTIEESIKKAMIELGIKPNDESNSTSYGKPNNEDVSLENYEEIERNPIKIESENIENPSEVFLKIKDGKIALFIPEGVKFSEKVIGDTNYSVLVFKAPDLGNIGLQPLEIEE